MRIALFHGYELRGSGSNEYNRYLSRALARQGHEVSLLCREPHPERVEHLTRAFDADGRELFSRGGDEVCVLHRLPDADVLPVFVTDKQREGQKAFPSLTDAELASFHRCSLTGVRAALARQPVDLLFANHLVWQPCVAAEAGVPFVVFPHGSSIEYTVRRDPRCAAAAREALRAARGLICGSDEVAQRIYGLFPEDADSLRARTGIVGVGVDTTLFAPVADRAEALGRIRGPFGGKRPDQSDELRRRLDAGELDSIRGVSYDRSQPDTDLPERLERLRGGRILLFVGALTAGKGVQALIAAMPELLASQPDAHLVLVGSGAYREVLEALVHALASGNRRLYDHLCAEGFSLEEGELDGPWTDLPPWPGACPALAERVHFAGRLDHGLLRHLFPCADLAVFPSVFPEAYPLVLLESLANGVLPVVSDFSGFADGLRTLEPLLGREWVDRMRIPMDDRCASMSRGLAGLLADPALDALRPRLREIAVEHFDWDVIARQLATTLGRFA